MRRSSLNSTLHLVKHRLSKRAEDDVYKLNPIEEGPTSAGLPEKNYFATRTIAESGRNLLRPVASPSEDTSTIYESW